MGEYCFQFLTAFFRLSDCGDDRKSGRAKNGIRDEWDPGEKRRGPTFLSQTLLVAHPLFRSSLELRTG